MKMTSKFFFTTDSCYFKFCYEQQSLLTFDFEVRAECPALRVLGRQRRGGPPQAGAGLARQPRPPGRGRARGRRREDHLQGRLRQADVCQVSFNAAAAAGPCFLLNGGSAQ